MESKSPFRIVTAASLFDGHDAAINLFRRLLQTSGMEVIHLGHNRSVKEIVLTAIQEDAHAICISSYQGGHLEFYTSILNSLKKENCEHIQVFGGGGGTILPKEIKQLQKLGVKRIYHPEDSRALGLPGIIKDIKHHLQSQHYPLLNLDQATKLADNNDLSDQQAASLITMAQFHNLSSKDLTPLLNKLQKNKKPPSPVIGFTGPGGAGKSSVIDEFISRYLQCSKQAKIGVVAFDPTKRKTGGALLADRLRMNAIYDGRVYLRSLATRNLSSSTGTCVESTLDILRNLNFDFIILETSGIGQSDSLIADFCDHSVYVMTPEYGASTQLEKIDMLDFADTIMLNKSDKSEAQAAFEDVLYNYRKSRDFSPNEPSPVFATAASCFNNQGIHEAFKHIISTLQTRFPSLKHINLKKLEHLQEEAHFTIIPQKRSYYLEEIAQTLYDYHKKSQTDAEKTSEYESLEKVLNSSNLDKSTKECLKEQKENLNCTNILKEIDNFLETYKKYEQDTYNLEAKGKTYTYPLNYTSLSGSKIPVVALPKNLHKDQILRFLREENFPGQFPFTNGVFPLKNPDEDPQRQFAGEGPPEKTNKRFHFLTKNQKAKRLSTAFDSVTLYGEDPESRMDIYGKIGNSGVSIATLDHMKALYKGFDLTDPNTSVSLTINGPAPVILAMFFNAAIDFEIEDKHKKTREQLSKEAYNTIKHEVLQKIRGTVQADILKEEQGQNTCIFSSRFALKMMGDIQEYFISQDIKKFYSVSISGYHIAEAGANPISQLAFTLANGFTYIEYYLSRGMNIDAFCSNLSFFFSNGLDAEYTVMGRVARRIWAVAMRDLYGASLKSSKLKYHIQTSGRSLHAQEIAFNDIRTTLQALLATMDYCNSLHTNAYDEAITTPTEESVRRAMAIQMIINKELGMSKCENPLSGSYFIEHLTNLVEEAVLKEFERISKRGGVLGSMEKQYQRHKIQEESMKYELMKGNGDLPIIGVNTFVSPTQNIDYDNLEVRRATKEEKDKQINSTKQFIKDSPRNLESLDSLRKVVLTGGNIFEELMETVKHASLGQITHLLYDCGGKYRRSM
jgi:isobutyryl-CoA mutase